MPGSSKFKAFMAKAMDPMTAVRQGHAADRLKEPNQEAKFYGNAPIQFSNESYFYPASEEDSYGDDFKTVQSSATGNWQSRMTTNLATNDLTALQMNNYMGGAVQEAAEDEFDGASQDGNVSDYEDDPDVEPEVAAKGLQEGAVQGLSDYDRLDDGQLHIMDNQFTDWSDLVNQNMPSESAIGEGSPDKDAARAAAVGGVNPDWGTTPTRNLRDLEQLPFAGRRGAMRQLAGFGVRPGEFTRERTNLPGSIGVGLARRELGRARAAFNKTADPLQRLTGPQHAGTSAEVPAAQAAASRRADALEVRKRVGAMRRANAASNRLEDVEEGAFRGTGNRKQAGSSWMNYTPLNLAKDRRGEATATPIAEVSEELEDDSLTSALKPDYFSAESMEDTSPQAPIYDAAAAEAEQVAAGGMTFEQEKASKALRNPKKAKLYARMAEAKARREAAPAQAEEARPAVRPQPSKGFFSRIGGALSKAGRVVGNALSSAGRGIASLFGFGSSRGAPATSSFDPAGRAQEARVMARDEQEEVSDSSEEAIPDVSRRLTFNASSPDYIQEKPEIKYGRMLDENYAKSRAIFSNFAEGYRRDATERAENQRVAELKREWAKAERANETAPERAARLATESGEGQATVFDSAEAFGGMPDLQEDNFVDEETKQAREAEKNAQWKRRQREIEADLHRRTQERQEQERKLQARQDKEFSAATGSADQTLKNDSENKVSQVATLHPAGIPWRDQDYFSAERTHALPQPISNADAHGGPASGSTELSEAANLPSSSGINLAPPSDQLMQAPAQTDVVESQPKAPPKSLQKLLNNPSLAAKAKLVGPQPTEADRAEGMRMLGANNAKIAENEANNKKFGYKAKKFFGMAKDQRIDPEYAGASENEAAELAMQSRLAHQERRKNVKKRSAQ